MELTQCQLCLAILGFLAAVFLNFPTPPFSQALTEWRGRGQFITFRGHQIFFRDEITSSGSIGMETLLCIHGFPTSSYDWNQVWKPLLTNKFHRVIAPDLLGFGFSDKPLNHSYSLMEQADMVEELMRKLKIDQVHILAHDYGDTVTQELLHRYEERQNSLQDGLVIKSVCLLNGGIFPEVNQPILVQQLMLHPLISFFLSRLNNYFIFSHSLNKVFGPETKLDKADLLDFWVLCRHKEGYLVLDRILQYINERKENRQRWVEALQHTTVPLFMIYGPSDVVNPSPEFPNYFREKVPKAKIELLEDKIGHYPQLEDSSHLLDIYFNFLHSF